MHQALPIVLLIIVGSTLLGVILVILGKLGLRRFYLSLISGIITTSLLLLAFFLNDHNLSTFIFVFSLITGIIFGVIAYFAIGIGLRIKKKN
jgi:hypothetical protein